MLFLIPLIVFLALLGGFCLHKYIPEEREQVKKSLLYAEKALVLLLILTLLYESFTLSLPMMLFLLGGIIAGFLFTEVYVYFGFALLSLSFLPAVLVFLYGLTQYKDFVLKAMFFLPFLFLFFSLETGLLQVFAVGALSVLFVKNVRGKK